MKKHVEKNAEETKKILNRMNRKDKPKPTLMSTVTSILDELREQDEFIRYTVSPTVCNMRTFYLCYNDDVFGEFYIKYGKYVSDDDSIHFIHGNAEISFEWKMLRDNIPRLKEILKAYTDGFDEFEEVIY